MQLDEGAREWLKDIEALAERQFDLQVARDKAASKKARAKTTKAAEAAAAALAEADQALAKTTEELTLETSAFFRKVLGITKDSLVALKRINQEPSAPLIVNTMTARLLSDNTAAFTVSGDSLTKNLTNGLPKNDYLLARESRGDALVPHG